MRLLERRLAAGGKRAGRAHLTDEGRAFLPKAVDVRRAYDRLFDDRLLEVDVRESSRHMTLGLLELTLASLSRELSEYDEDRIGCPSG